MSGFIKFVGSEYHLYSQKLHTTCGKPIYSTDGSVQVLYCPTCHVFDTQAIEALTAVTQWIAELRAKYDDEWRFEDAPEFSEETNADLKYQIDIGVHWERIWHFVGESIDKHERLLYVALLPDGKYLVIPGQTEEDDLDEEEEEEEE